MRGMPAPYRLADRVSLRELNTFKVDACAACLARVPQAEALRGLLALERFAAAPVLVLGQGSNVLFADDFPGLVITLELTGIEVLVDDEHGTLLRVGAGVGWDELVTWTLERGYAGLENLALIPGLTGAAPIQNIGAYGVEIREFIAAVTAWDRTAQLFVTLTNAECAFDYRDSRFKRESGRWIITSLDLRLPRQRELALQYAGLRQELAALGVGTPRAIDVASAVRRLRRRKLPDPARIGNAGSFFKNPVVSRSVAEALMAGHAGLPWHPTPSAEEVKLSAAWIIEACGLKGYRVGDAAVSTQHALVLVNRGRATGGELLAVAQHVIDTVAERFGIQLEPEPCIIRSGT